MTGAYLDFLRDKAIAAPSIGFHVDQADLHPWLKPHCRAIEAPRLTGTGDPREHVCACGCRALACYGVGNVWFAYGHQPFDFFDLARGGQP